MFAQADSDTRLQIINLEELEERARKQLDPASYDYIAGGAGSERTLKANREAFDKITIIPRVLTGIKQVDTTTNLLGHQLRMPIYVTPMASQGLAHPLGEVGTSTGAVMAGTLFVASTGSTKSLEEVASAMKNGPRWFQLYLNKDLEISKDLLRRAEKAGYSAIVLTVDLPILGLRERDTRNRFIQTPDQNPSNNPSSQSQGAMRNLQTLIAGMKDDISWDDYEWTRKHTTLPVLIKGILSPEDAEEAARRKVPAIIVSNHGGRQLDTGFGAIAALPPIIDKVAGRTRVLFDSGIRRGTDVFKALALGADAVGVGRPALWGLAVAGAEGVAAVLDHLRMELANVMRLAGTARTVEITRKFVD